MPEPAAAERAYALTKERVLSGELAGGSLLSEGEVAEQLGMSRTPVREAFLRLEAEELLSLIPKRGAVVVPVPPGEADDVLDAREAIETAAVRRLVRTPAAVPAAVADLRAALSEQRGHAVPEDIDAFARADEAFHRAIVAAGGNALTGRFYRTLADRQRRMTVRAIDGDPRFIARVLDDHEELIRIIASGDGSAFAAALRAHLDGTHRR